MKLKLFIKYIYFTLSEKYNYSTISPRSNRYRTEKKKFATGLCVPSRTFRSAPLSSQLLVSEINSRAKIGMALKWHQVLYRLTMSLSVLNKILKASNIDGDAWIVQQNWLGADSPAWNRNNSSYWLWSEIFHLENFARPCFDFIRRTGKF